MLNDLNIIMHEKKKKNLQLNACIYLQLHTLTVYLFKVQNCKLAKDEVKIKCTYNFVALKPVTSMPSMPVCLFLIKNKYKTNASDQTEMFVNLNGN